MTDSYQFFPPLNASLNAVSGILLVTGVAMIRSGRREAHIACMIGALTASTAFLISYLIYHYQAGHTTFPKEYPIARRIYLPLLASHIILAVIVVPLAIITVVNAIRGRFEKHRRIARWTFPVWLYVSVTGVIIYFMIYHWFVPTRPDTGESPAEIEFTGPSLAYEPEIFEKKVRAEDSEVTVVFNLRNKGPRPVRIRKLDTTCSCLSVEAGSHTIDPGKETKITAVFDISKLTGEAEKAVIVETDDPEERERRLPVRVSIPPIYEFSPETVGWDVGEKPESKTVDFKVLREKPIRLVEAKSSRRQVALETETVEEGRHYRFILTPESTDDILLGFIQVVTDCELEQHRRRIVIYAIEKPDGE